MIKSRIKMMSGNGSESVKSFRLLSLLNLNPNLTLILTPAPIPTH